MNTKEMTASCGLACWTCGVYKDNITEEVAYEVAKSMGLSVEDIPCDGCRSVTGCSFEQSATGGKGCKTKQCVWDKGIHNCSECDVFPCESLMPVADMAGDLPHNTKLYNLSRIKLIGLEAWAEEAAKIQRKYFKGKFVYGQAPYIDEE